MKIKTCCATLVYFAFALEDNAVPRLSPAVPILQPSTSPWWSLGSAQLSGEEERVGWHKELPSEHLCPGGWDGQTNCWGNALRAAFKAEKYSSGVEATLEKMMMLFSLSPPAARSSVRAMQRWWCGLSLGLSGRAREGLKECDYFKGKRFTWSPQKSFFYAGRGCERDCEPVQSHSAVGHWFSLTVLDIMVLITKKELIHYWIF